MSFGQRLMQKKVFPDDSSDEDGNADDHNDHIWSSLQCVDVIRGDGDTVTSQLFKWGVYLDAQMR